MFTLTTDYKSELTTLKISGHVTADELQEMLGQLTEARKGFQGSSMIWVRLSNVILDWYYLGDVDISMLTERVKDLQKAVISVEDESELTPKIASLLKETYDKCNVPCMVLNSEVDALKQLEMN